jgi:branched-chain amino acid transport system ATP-binding protein
MSAPLEVQELSVSYGRVRAMHGVSLHVAPGSIVAVFGANGAGKTTLLRAISGIVSVVEGTISFGGTRLNGRRADEILRLGIAHVPQGRELFTGLTVAENLMLGGYLRRRPEVEEGLALVASLFPILRERANQRAGMLSGGEQQMLAIGRALMAKPGLLMLDEPSMGLAPLVRDEVMRVIRQLNQERGMTILVVEQEVEAALEISNYCYVLETGRVAAEGRSADLRQSRQIQQLYLGGAR